VMPDMTITRKYTRDIALQEDTIDLTRQITLVLPEICSTKQSHSINFLWREYATRNDQLLQIGYIILQTR
jgi:hypothetical protein